MHYWQLHVAARKRIKARRDILSLLKNSHPKRPKNKKKRSFTQKRFGIFANAISFKIVRENGNELGDELPTQFKEPAETVHVKGLKRTKPAKDLLEVYQGFDVIQIPEKSHHETIIQNFNDNGTQQVQLPSESRGKRAAVSPEETTCSNVWNDKHNHEASAPNHTMHPKTTDHNDNVIDGNLLSHQINAFTDFTFNNGPQTAMLTFDSLIDENSPNAPTVISSVNFNKFETQIGADDCSSFTAILGSCSNNNSILSGILFELDNFGYDLIELSLSIFHRFLFRLSINIRC